MKHIFPADFGVLSVSRRNLSITLAAFAGGILAVGYFREIFIAIEGPSTFLGDLRHIALTNSQFSILSWFQSLVLALNGLMFAVVALLSVRVADKDSRRWAFLASLFAMMSVDESANLHQLILSPIRSLGGAWTVSASWLPLVPATALSLYLLPMLFRMKRSHALRFVVCGVVFVSGAIILDAISATMAIEYGPSSFEQTIEVAEETLETIGSVALCAALANYIASKWPRLSLAIG